MVRLELLKFLPCGKSTMHRKIKEYKRINYLIFKNFLKQRDTKNTITWCSGGEEEFINIKIWLHNKTVNRLNIIDFIIFNNLFYPKYLY